MTLKGIFLLYCFEVHVILKTKDSPWTATSGIASTKVLFTINSFLTNCSCIQLLLNVRRLQLDLLFSTLG